MTLCNIQKQHIFSFLTKVNKFLASAWQPLEKAKVITDYHTQFWPVLYVWLFSNVTRVGSSNVTWVGSSPAGSYCYEVTKCCASAWWALEKGDIQAKIIMDKRPDSRSVWTVWLFSNVTTYMTVQKIVHYWRLIDFMY
jgi:hypothetical protein